MGPKSSMGHKMVLQQDHETACHDHIGVGDAIAYRQIRFIESKWNNFIRCSNNSTNIAEDNDKKRMQLNQLLKHEYLSIIRNSMWSHAWHLRNVLLQSRFLYENSSEFNAAKKIYKHDVEYI